jgi:hypothetical protein
MKSSRCFSFSFRITTVMTMPIFFLLALALPVLAQSDADLSVRDSSLADAPRHLQGKGVNVMVEMEAAPAAVSYAAALKQAQAQADAAKNYALAHPKAKTSQAILRQKQSVQISSAAATQVKSVVSSLDSAQQTLVPRLTSPEVGGTVLFRVQRAYNGIAMVVSPDKIAAIAAMPGVKAVHPMHPKFATAAFSSVDFIGARSFWRFFLHGETIKVADIDSGLDYIHTNFGGPGSAGYGAVPNHTTAPNAYFPSAKVPGGFDFVGDTYDADPNSATYQPVPHPDPDPFDCGGHGTGTASLIAGFGVTNAGTTYTGSYNASAPAMATLAISPGIAPKALLYPLRVFGCGGSTDVVVQAIDYAMDPNADGNFSDHYDVINMSLGSNEGFADDPDDVAASNAASIGTLVCSAAGNAGDSYYIHSSPAAAPGTLGVAASFNDQNGYIYDATVTGNAPPAFAGQQDKSIYTTTSPHTSATGDVVYAIDADPASGSTHDGSAPLTNSGAVAGNIALVDRIPGQGSNASVNCQNAGAVGIIDIADNASGGNPFLLTTSPLLTKPMVVCSTAYGNAIKAAAAFDGNGVSTTTPKLNVTIAPNTTYPPTVVQGPNGPGSPAGPGSPDTLPTYTSRGPRLPDSAIKPDLTAPAEVTGVALTGTGNGVENFNGTSSATPHVSGFMALLRQLQPSWSVQELNALACCTATHDLFTTVGGVGGSQIGIGRIGAGRIDLTKASTANVVAYNGTDPNLIGVSFGVVETPADTSRTLTKNISVVNKSAVPVTYNVTYQNVVPLTGATVSFPTNSFTVNAGATFTVPVQLAVTGNQLKHAREASVTATLGGNSRQWLTETNGYAVFTPTGGSEPTIRVAVYAAPKPVSAMQVTNLDVVPASPLNTGSFTINLTGTPVNTGASLGNGFDILSLAKAVELQYQSDLVGTPNPPTDPNIIKYFGVTSDYQLRSVGAGKGGTRLVLGMEGFGNAATPDFASSDKEILIDSFSGTTAPGNPPITPGVPDGDPDYQIFLSSVTGAVNAYVAKVIDLHQGAITSQTFTNGLPAAAADTNIFNNSAVTIRVNASILQLLLGGTGPGTFDYAVVTFDRANQIVDFTPSVSYDIANPGFDLATSFNTSAKTQNPGALFEDFMYNDVPGNAITVNYNGTNFRNLGSLGVLVFHMHNGTGHHSDVVAFRKPTLSSFSPTNPHRGGFVTLTGSNYGPGTAVTFNNTPASSVNVITSNTISAQVAPTTPLGAGAVRVSNAAGSSVRGGLFVQP